MVVHMRDGEVPVASDERLDFLRDFILKALRLKPDKWDRMFISDEQRSFITNFVDNPSGHPQVGVFYHLSIKETDSKKSRRDQN